MVARNQASETGQMLVNFDIFFKWRTPANAPIRTGSFVLSCRNFAKKTPEPFLVPAPNLPVVEIVNILTLGKLWLLPGLA